MFIFVQARDSCKWVDDSQHLVMEHFEAICNSPSQIYHSVLPLCPSSSWLHKHYAAELSQEVKVVGGLSAGWGTCSRTVTLVQIPQTLTCWRDTIAVGLDSGEIITLDGITGIQTAILSGHTGYVRSLAFFPNGRSLVSGSNDRTVKLWDVQTGGTVRTFCGHTNHVNSVSISEDCTMIASGSNDMTIRLWNIQTGDCHHVIMQHNHVDHVVFYRTNTERTYFHPDHHQRLASVSGDRIRHWNIKGDQINSGHFGSCFAIASHNSNMVYGYDWNLVVRKSYGGDIQAKFHVASRTVQHCCISSSGGLIAAASGFTAHVWYSSPSHPHPIKTFVGHTGAINSLAFFSSDSLVSSSDDKSIKFWEVDTRQVANSESTSITSAPIKSIALQAEDGIVISSDSDGMVRTWDISSGLCKASFKALSVNTGKSDARLINSRLIFVWCILGTINILDVEKKQLLQTIYVTLDVGGGDVEDVRISGDGSNVFCLQSQSIQAWSIQTGEVVGAVELVGCGSKRSLIVDGSRAWIHSPVSEPIGWDFRTPGSPSVQLSGPSLLFAKNTKLWDGGQSKLKDAVTGRVVFQLAGRLANPVTSQWDGHYLVTGYGSGEVLILDFNHAHF